jgi:hypothetical protein
MKLFLLTTCILAFLAVETAFGRLVAISDDFILGQYFTASGSSAPLFTLDTFGWLCAPTGNRNVLVDQAYTLAHPMQPFLTTLANAGYNVTVSSPSTWSAATFNNYGAVLWERGAGQTGLFDGSQLVSYVQHGGGVAVVSGGDNDPMQQHNNLLNPFGVTEGTQINGADYTITSFANHPITQGVTQLNANGPAPMSLLNGSSATVVSAQYGVDWLIAVDVPEPNAGQLMLVAGGMFLMLGRVRARRAAAN